MSMRQEIPKVVAWLRQQVKNSHTKGLVVGLSGGIDSSVCAALAKKAFPDHSLGIIIPIHSHPQDAEDARVVAEQLGLAYYVLELSNVHQAILDRSVQALTQYPIETDQSAGRLADANLRARLRMAAIYTAANALNYLVVGTDNAAELYTGYFTKYGDGGCDILPLADFAKSEVRQLARELGLPSRIVEKAPSAGLWEGQTDEKEMGTTYDMIDAFLRGEDIPERDRDIIEKLHQRSEHKRHTPPQYRR